jgi:hypothetical protein
MAGMDSHFFETLDVPEIEGRRVIDFTTPAAHRYRRTGFTVISPHIAEG